MASPNSVFTEMVATTLRNHPSEVSDNVANHNALYRRLRDRSKIVSLDGGYEIVRPLDYAENSTFVRYSGYDVLDVGQSDVLSAAKYDWVHSAVHITASGDELRKNSGKENIIDLVRSRLRNGMRTAANNMSVDLYSDGALANQMNGLAAMITDDGKGTVGGIDASVYAFCANQFETPSGAPDSSTIRPRMQSLWLKCVRGTDMPDLIVSTHDYYSFYWASLTDQQRYTNDEKNPSNAGFNALKFNSCDVIFDDNSNFAQDGSHMFFLNTDYLELVQHRQASWSQMEEKVPVNQDAVVVPLIWQGNLCCSNRSLQGYLGQT